ncbi:hypothetical protein CAUPRSCDRAFT_10438 [Caulochytrium protostelioides]|uniref:Uncharacterized protein n=1 Tax=Caulochytrium protostelioides TaxID=1555241 RepID=A0A4P9WYY5_9FUNG|nr:hypothetical protein CAUPRSCDRAFT_10438 [Caulochytrium protostelioides]
MNGNVWCRWTLYSLVVLVGIATCKSVIAMPMNGAHLKGTSNPLSTAAMAVGDDSMPHVQDRDIFFRGVLRVLAPPAETSSNMLHIPPQLAVSEAMAMVDALFLPSDRDLGRLLIAIKGDNWAGGLDNSHSIPYSSNIANAASRDDAAAIQIDTELRGLIVRIRQYGEAHKLKLHIDRYDKTSNGISAKNQVIISKFSGLYIAWRHALLKQSYARDVAQCDDAIAKLGQMTQALEKRVNSRKSADSKDSRRHQADTAVPQYLEDSIARIKQEASIAPGYLLPIFEVQNDENVVRHLIRSSVHDINMFESFCDRSSMQFSANLDETFIPILLTDLKALIADIEKTKEKNLMILKDLPFEAGSHQDISKNRPPSEASTMDGTVSRFLYLQSMSGKWHAWNTYQRLVHHGLWALTERGRIDVVEHDTVLVQSHIIYFGHTHSIAQPSPILSSAQDLVGSIASEIRQSAGLRSVSDLLDHMNELLHLLRGKVIRTLEAWKNPPNSDASDSDSDLDKPSTQIRYQDDPIDILTDMLQDIRSVLSPALRSPWSTLEDVLASFPVAERSYLLTFQSVTYDMRGLPQTVHEDIEKRMEQIQDWLELAQNQVNQARRATTTKSSELALDLLHLGSGIQWHRDHTALPVVAPREPPMNKLPKLDKLARSQRAGPNASQSFFKILNAPVLHRP